MVPRSWLGTLRWWPGVLVALMLAAVLAWLLSAFEQTPPPARDPDAIDARSPCRYEITPAASGTTVPRPIR